MAAEGLFISGGACLLGGFVAFCAGEDAKKRARYLNGAHPRRLPVLANEFKRGRAPSRVAVSGLVTAAKPVISSLSGREGAILEITENQVWEIYVPPAEGQQAGTWQRHHRELRNDRIEASWALKDGTGEELPVHGRKGMDEFMQNVGDRMTPSNEKGRDRLAERELGERSVGVQTVERILPLGVQMTAVGKLSTSLDNPTAHPGALRHDGHMLVLRPKIVSRKSYKQLLEDAETAGGEMAMVGNVCFCLGGGLVAAGLLVHVVGKIRK